MRVSNKPIPLEREERESRSAEPYDRVHTGADTPVLILRTKFLKSAIVGSPSFLKFLSTSSASSTRMKYQLEKFFLKRKLLESARKRSSMNLHAASKTMGVSIVDDKRCRLSSMFTWKCHGRGRQGRTHKFLQRTSKYISTLSDSRADGA